MARMCLSADLSETASAIQNSGCDEGHREFIIDTETVGQEGHGGYRKQLNCQGTYKGK